MSEHNPNNPPALVQESDSGVRGADRDPSFVADEVTDVGPWREKELLVIRMNNQQLPSRCIKTNENVEGERTTLRLIWIPSHHVWLLMLGVIGHLIAKATGGKTIAVQAPIAPQWLARQKLVARIGWGMVIAGVVGIVVGTVLSMVTASQTVDATTKQYFLSKYKGPSLENAERDSNIALAVTVACPLISVAGVVFLALLHKPIVVARNVERGYVWLDGVSREYLNLLAPWPGFQLESDD